MKKVVIVSIFDSGKHMVKRDLKEDLMTHNKRLRIYKRISQRKIGYYSGIAMKSYYDNKAWVRQILQAMQGRFNVIVVRDYTNAPTGDDIDEERDVRMA